MKKRCLVSVSDKTGIVEFCKKLNQFSYQIISTGGTYKVLKENGIDVISVEEVTHFPEILDGRVKTLHPMIHGGLLYIRKNENHVKQAQDLKIEAIDMIVVNLYPFKNTIETEDATFQDAIENIDIGGPSMLRSGSKNFENVCVLCDPDDYESIIAELEEETHEISLMTRKKLAAKAFRHTASYDAVISQFLTEQAGEENPEKITLTYDLKQTLRYGENPHQRASFYRGKRLPYSLSFGEQIHGKELSYNNINDGNSALDLLMEFEEPCAVALKHMNPCGVGIGVTLKEAFEKAYEADKVSIFGGIVALNRKVTKDVALLLKPIFLEIVLAPSFEEDALEILRKKKDLRLIVIDMSKKISSSKKIMSVNGGLLVQEQDLSFADRKDLIGVTQAKASEEDIEQLLFLMKVCKHVKSNAIVVGNNFRTLGIGAGQMNRIGSSSIALEEAQKKNDEKLYLASDAFFPFSDAVELASRYHVEAIIQPGGSIRDQEVIDACNKYGIKMIFTHMRHFKH